MIVTKVNKSLYVRDMNDELGVFFEPESSRELTYLMREDTIWETYGGDYSMQKVAAPFHNVSQFMVRKQTEELNIEDKNCANIEPQRVIKFINGGQNPVSVLYLNRQPESPLDFNDNAESIIVDVGILVFDGDGPIYIAAGNLIENYTGNVETITVDGADFYVINSPAEIILGGVK